jgi:hypothetical protein
MNNTLLVEHIKKHLPAGARLHSYLMDTLFLSKEPAYRRIRGEIPFTFEEVVKLAANLGFSIDNIVQQSMSDSNIVQFNMPVNVEASVFEKFSNNLDINISVAKQFETAKNLNVKVAINRIPWMLLPYPNLFKFEICRFLRYYGQIDFTTTFANIDIPASLLDKNKQLAYYVSKIHNLNCICDKHIFDKVIEEIKYIYDNNFLGKEDLLKLQNELYQFLQKLLDANIGVSNIFGDNCNFFICSTFIDTNIIHIEMNDKVLDQFWIFIEMPIVIKNNPTMSYLQSRLIESRKAFSSLITKSNNSNLSSAYFNIKKLIDSLSENL